MIYDVIIIGAGPSGIFAGLSAREKEKKVLVLEGGDKPLKKLIISGGGRCNLTNSGEIKDFLECYHEIEKKRFLKNSFYHFGPEELKAFFKKNGLPLLLTESTGKYFPKTNSALDVKELLLNKCQKDGVSLKKNTKVNKLYFDKDDKLFIINTDLEIFKAKKIILATGGKTYPKTGSDGSGYKLAKNMGHTLIECAPALAPIYLRDYPFGEVSGLTLKNPELKVISEGKILYKKRASLLFTHKNITGPGPMDASHYVKRGMTIVLNFLRVSSEELEEYLLDAIESRGKYQLKTILKDFELPQSLLSKLLSLANIDNSLIIGQMSKKERKQVIKALTGYELRVDEIGDFNQGMVTKGGIPLKEVNPKTMESRIQKGLYLVGELLDIDGITGGYNIQAAISTGVLAGSNI